MNFCTVCKLKLIGLAGKKAKTPIAAPGQTRLLEVPKQGAGWVFLDWKAPINGGKPRVYKVQRRVVGSEPVSDRWEDIATAILIRGYFSRSTPKNRNRIMCYSIK